MGKDAMIPRAQRTQVNAEYASIDKYVSEYVMNVSRTGAFIRSNDPLPVGTRVNLRFSLLLDEIEIVEGVAEVVRVQASPKGMGVVFRRLSEASSKLLERLEPNGATPR
ncbi:MAG TPA: PilZ domain-containing protein [Pseudomonadota bacterium]|jgi:Tfp pilus assembly protein PilZ|nr:PilZ domain-containing protein [Pseudomonadota bacterium]